MVAVFRTLFITSDIVYPPARGAPLRTWQNINAMMEHGAIGFFSITWFEWERITPPGVDLWHYEYILPPVKPPTDLIIDRNISYYYSYAAGQKLEEIMNQFQPDLVIFEEIWTYLYLPIVNRYQCRIIFDNHNVEIDLYRQEMSDNSKLGSQLEYERRKFIEQDFISQTDQTWVCSQEDACILKEIYGQNQNIYVVPNSVDVVSYNCVRFQQYLSLKELEPKEHNIIFSATFGYLPNREAAEVLIEQIYPQLRKIYPNCRLLLVGQEPTAYMQQVAEQETGIIVTRAVPDVRPYLASASVLVAPLFKGGGTRLKILEAFAAGCPVISTAKGAEGLKVTDGEHLLIRNTPEEMVAGVCQLWSEPFLGQRLAESAYQLVQAEYSWEAVKPKVERAIRQLF